MKLNKLALLGMLCTAGLFGNVAALAATSNLPVSATVVGTCKFVTAGAVTFTLDPSSAAAAPGSVTAPTFWCTKGASYSVTSGNGTNASGTQKRLSNGATTPEYINYTLSLTTNASGTGSGPATAISLGVSSSVANADFVGASAGSYSDSVLLTITP